MINLDSILGQPGVVRKLRMDMAGQRLAGAYLFSGLDGVGKGTAALAFATEVLCVESRGCGNCPSCRQVAAGTQPGIKRVLPTADRGALPTLKVHQIDSILAELAFKSYGGGRRFVIIEDIYTGTRESLNRLLKSLEEPPDEATLILTTTSRDAVLPTIASRCRLITFQALSTSVLSQLRDQWAEPGNENLAKQKSTRKKKASVAPHPSGSSVSLPWLAETSRGIVLDADDEADLNAVKNCLDQDFSAAGIEGLFPQTVLLDRRRASARLGLLALALRDSMTRGAVDGYPSLLPGLEGQGINWKKGLGLGTKFLRLILETQDTLRENANISLAADVFRLSAAKLLAPTAAGASG